MPLPVLSRQPREVLRIAGTPIPQRAAVDEALDLRHHLDVLRAHRWLIVSVAALCLLAAALYALVARPVYEANMLFHVEEVSPNASRNILNDVSSLFDTKKEAVAEMELLRSRAVIEPAVLRLRLDLDAAPNYLPLLERWLGDWPGPPLLPPGVFGYGGYGWGGERIVVGEFAVPEPLLGHGFTLTARAGDGYDLSSEEDGIAATGRVGWPLSVATPNGTLVLTVQRLQALPGTRFRLMRITPQAAVERVQRAMTVSEQGRQSGVISVRLRGDAPQLSRDTLSEIGREYLRQNRARKVEEAERSLAFLNGQLPELRQRLEQSEDQYSRFRTAHGTIDLAEEARISLQRVAAAQQRRADLEQKRTELLARYTSEHPIVQGVAAQLRGVDREIAEATRRIESLPALEQDAARMAREIKVNTELYTALSNTAQQLRLVSAGQVSNVRLVDAPVAPDKPLRPNRPLIVAAGAGAGLLLGCVAALARDYWRGGIRDPQRVEQLLGASVVHAVVPHSSAQDALARAGRRKDQPMLPLLATDAPDDVAVEALRVFRTALLHALPGFKNKAVMLSSPLPGQGKSFLTANLAAVTAASGKRVLLIDADWRNGSLHRYFGLAHAPGLSEALVEQAPLAQIVHRNVLANLDFIATGSLPSGRAEFLMHASFGALLERAGAEYDLILLDPPPVLALADALVIGAQAGAVYLVARAGVNGQTDILEAVRRLNQANAPLHGLIFNDLYLRLSSYGYRYHDSDVQRLVGSG
ncbi:polysaccharide biosynthesis tyrosine autokinase [Pseudoduganella sp. FT25W]|uniref:Polysaccharide biosynthesis tyrosine autokinase n=1 Tax=Duganella alba TaxID=2666081 RepID=A0A6L5QLN3_9BURK|nr:polysaccharide biosynthesis tyrosine autokinase [Duganella alba]MRX10587.1 polysaccharide biosynthesis tyrosine autokinase [Duganella alba]MRX15794.1 polysaccharide biosynthesis tyrosine autokinase [Duganella alba]